ncbi:GNAT family N-acetyltransferase, partial [Vibrio cincinnatiensis]|nr:GNAT family N-acetyltransferase [Vibrio cincinnatiensis]
MVVNISMIEIRKYQESDALDL